MVGRMFEPPQQLRATREFPESAKLVLTHPPRAPRLQAAAVKLSSGAKTAII